MKSSLFAVTTVLALATLAAPAHAVEYTGDPTSTTNLNGGPDPLGFLSFSQKVVVHISGKANPVSHTATSATYSVGTGAVSVAANASTGEKHFKSTGSGTIKISVPAKGPNVLTVKAPFTYRGSAFTITWVFSLPSGSFSTAALKHPKPFSPSAINISSPASNLTYTLSGKTELGLSGTIDSF